MHCHNPTSLNRGDEERRGERVGSYSGRREMQKKGQENAAREGERGKKVREMARPVRVAGEGKNDPKLNYH